MAIHAHRSWLTSFALMSVLALVAAWGAIGFAEEGPPAPAKTKMDLAACVSSALAHHPALKAAQAEVEGAAAGIAEARARRVPHLSAQAGYLEVDENPSFSMAGMPTFVFGDQSNTWGSVDLQVPLYTGGALEAMEARARWEREAADANLDRQRQLIAGDAAKAYFRALTARHMVTVMEKQVEAVKEALRVARALHEQGVAAKLDVLQAETGYAGARDMLLKTKNQYQVALAALRHAVGLPPGESVEPVENGAEEQFLQGYPTDLKTALDTALAQRPEARQLRAYRQAAEAGRKAALGQLRPSLGLQASWEPQRTTLMPEYGNWKVAVVIQQRLYDGNEARSQARQAEAQAKKASDKLDELASGITVQVTNAIRSLESANDRLEVTRKATKAAEEAWRLALVGYKNGVTPMLDVLQAQAGLAKARADEEVAGYDRAAAIVDLYVASGKIVGQSWNAKAETEAPQEGSSEE